MSSEKEKGGHGLLVYSVAHFVVDFSCAFIMAGMVMEKETGAALLLIYNFCAFAMQMMVCPICLYFNSPPIAHASTSFAVNISHGSLSILP